MGDVMGLCVSVAHATSTVMIGPTVQPIYLQHPAQLANQAAYLHEISQGRFHLGIGVTHGPVHSRLGVAPGKPLTDTRNYVADMRAAAGAGTGDLPPITLATLRDKMVSLSSEIADGAVWANASRSHMGHSLALISDEKKAAGFFVGNMIPTVIDDDREAAAARNRATLKGYVTLPNYRNYWKEAGYVEEMEAVEKAMETKDGDALLKAMTDTWLSDCTLYGSAGEVRDDLRVRHHALKAFRGRLAKIELIAEFAEKFAISCGVSLTTRCEYPSTSRCCFALGAVGWISRVQCAGGSPRGDPNGNGCSPSCWWEPPRAWLSPSAPARATSRRIRRTI